MTQLTLGMPTIEKKRKPLKPRHKASLLALTLGRPVALAGVWYPPGMWDSPIPRSILVRLRDQGLVTWDDASGSAPHLTQRGLDRVQEIQAEIGDVRTFVRRTLQRPNSKLSARRRRR